MMIDRLLDDPRPPGNVVDARPLAAFQNGMERGVENFLSGFCVHTPRGLPTYRMC